MASGGSAPGEMTGRLAHVCRHPIKAIGHEELARVRLAPGRRLPLDRRWAVAHAEADIAPGPGGVIDSWVPKGRFLRGVAAPELMAIRAEATAEGNDARLALTHPKAGRLDIRPAAPGAGKALISWLHPLWPADLPAPQALVTLQEGGLTDRPEPFVSLLSLGSLRALEAQMGVPLSIHRFRGNLWVDGLPPWVEFDLVGREICIGATRLRVERRITRCKATCANPETGALDADTLGALKDAYGHRDFGVYVTVLDGGEISPGDQVLIP
ncbi:MOSC domain-containing protein [Alkalilacustris brevis]|uniref:MOSC domain-containing protein n=1 Tax=Alkalilacustris brevis TaxID=2026338 RepID=UPI001EE3D05D|nr:MOSC domain-containing protein [Alkalilacustris brevis]